MACFLESNTDMKDSHLVGPPKNQRVAILQHLHWHCAWVARPHV